jgi:hypothetical protein
VQSFLANNKLGKTVSGTKGRGSGDETRTTSENLTKNLNPPFGSHYIAITIAIVIAIGACGADSPD